MPRDPQVVGRNISNSSQTEPEPEPGSGGRHSEVTRARPNFVSPNGCFDTNGLS